VCGCVEIKFYNKRVTYVLPKLKENNLYLIESNMIVVYILLWWCIKMHPTPLCYTYVGCNSLHHCLMSVRFEPYKWSNVYL